MQVGSHSAVGALVAAELTDAVGVVRGSVLELRAAANDWSAAVRHRPEWALGSWTLRRASTTIDLDAAQDAYRRATAAIEAVRTGVELLAKRVQSIDTVGDAVLDEVVTEALTTPLYRRPRSGWGPADSVFDQKINDVRTETLEWMRRVLSRSMADGAVTGRQRLPPDGTSFPNAVARYMHRITELEDRVDASHRRLDSYVDASAARAAVERRMADIGAGYGDPALRAAARDLDDAVQRFSNAANLARVLGTTDRGADSAVALHAATLDVRAINVSAGVGEAVAHAGA